MLWIGVATIFIITTTIIIIAPAGYLEGTKIIDVDGIFVMHLVGSAHVVHDGVQGAEDKTQVPFQVTLALCGVQLLHSLLRAHTYRVVSYHYQPGHQHW